MGQTEVEYKTRPQNEFVRIWIYGCNEIKQLSILKQILNHSRKAILILFNIQKCILFVWNDVIKDSNF